MEAAECREQAAKAAAAHHKETWPRLAGDCARGGQTRPLTKPLEGTRRPQSEATKIDLNHSPPRPVEHAEATPMMPDQLARQEQIARRLEQSRRLLRGVTDAPTAMRIGNLIDDLEREQVEENEK